MTKFIKIEVPDSFDPDVDKIILDSEICETQCAIWQPLYQDILDHGFLGLIDHMGDDSAVTRSARVSYGAGTKRVSEDRNLIRYLLRNHHSTPFESVEFQFHVKTPIFVMRQWVRHRTACLAGDVKLTFDLPGGVQRKGQQAYSLTVKQIFDKFRPTHNKTRPDKQGNPHFKRHRAEGMLLRSCNEDSLTLYHTHVTDIWENGVKPVLRVEFENKGVLRATADHRCFTDMGWMRLEDALQSGARFASVARETGYSAFDPEFTDAELDSEQWQVIPSNESYEVSSLGRVRSLFNTWGNRHEIPVMKLPTSTPAGYRLVSLSRDCKTRTRFVHHLVLEAFDSRKIPDGQSRHLDGNRANNRLSNLKWGSAAENTTDRMQNGCDQRLSVVFVKPVSVVEDGQEMTYDLEVEGPYHNFIAGGVFVHNSINEYSGRYSVMTDNTYMPEISVLKPQSKSNKQGRAGALSINNAYACQLQLQHIFKEASQAYRYLLGNSPIPSTALNTRYDIIKQFAMDRIKWLQANNSQWQPDLVTEEMIDGKIKEIVVANGLAFTDDDFWGEDGEGLSRELARIGLTLSTYTEFYWKANLRNIFHFIELRSSDHAQYEIRVYSDAILEMIKPIVPDCVEAFLDYQMHGRQLSRMEIEVVRVLYQKFGATEFDHEIEEIMLGYGASKREIREFISALRLGSRE